jgi:hypothetical protein
MEKLKPLLASWARSFLAASIACYLAGVTDWKALFGAGAGRRLARDLAILKSCGFSIRAY